MDQNEFDFENQQPLHAKKNDPVTSQQHLDQVSKDLPRKLKRALLLISCHQGFSAKQIEKFHREQGLDDLEGGEVWKFARRLELMGLISRVHTDGERALRIHVTEQGRKVLYDCESIICQT